MDHFGGHLIRARRISALVIAMTAASLPAFPSFAETNEVASATRVVDAVLVFVGGAPLSARDRAKAATETAARFGSDPSGMRRVAAQLQDLLNKLPGAAPLDIAEARQHLRLGVALLPQSDRYRQIVESKDPTVVFDRGHQRLVTEATLTAWRRACEWVAELYDVPAPQDAFIATQRSFVRERFSTLSAIQKDGIADIESTYPMAVLFVSRADRAKLAAAIASDRTEFTDRKRFALDAAEGLEKVDMAAMHELFIQRLIANTIVLNSGASMNYFNHRSYHNLLDR